MGDVKKKIIRDIKQRNIGNGYFLLKRKYNDNQKRINMSIATSFPKNYNLGNYYNTNNKSKQVYNNQKQFGNPAVIQPVPWEGNKEKFIKTANEAGADTLEWVVNMYWLIPLNNGTQVTFEYHTGFSIINPEGKKIPWKQVMMSQYGGVYKINKGDKWQCSSITYSGSFLLPLYSWVQTPDAYFGPDVTTVPSQIQVGGYYRGVNDVNTIPLFNGVFYEIANSNCEQYPKITVYTNIPT
jgi:hypothetical protein